MVMVTAKVFQLLKTHIQALQSKILNVLDMFRNESVVICEIWKNKKKVFRGKESWSIIWLICNKIIMVYQLEETKIT